MFFHSTQTKVIAVSSFFGIFVLILVFIWLLSSIALNSATSSNGISHLTVDATLVQGRNGAVSSENKLCSDIGVDILKKGGSAVDSAIAASLCIGTVNMYSSGIGGGGFMIIKSTNGSSETIDFREEAGEQAFPDMFNKDPELSQSSGLASGVPGEIRGFELAHKRHGKLPWKDLFKPSIDIARYGWPMDEKLEQKMWALGSKKILASPGFMEIFIRNGKLLRKGDTVLRQTYADTLETIANQGPDTFYTGKIGESILETIKKNKGTLELSDFKNYKAKIKAPVEGYYHGKRILTCPLPSSGPVLISALNILEGFPLEKQGKTLLNLHRTVESIKFAYAQRAFYGDPVFVEANTSDLQYPNMSRVADEFIRKETAYLNRRKISDKHTLKLKEYGAPFDIISNHGTASLMHLSVLGPDGDAVALTSTINLLFGSQIVDYNTGIILNNEMDDFSIPGHSNAFGYPPSPYNFAKPGKRPLSSAVPTIIEDNGETRMVVGASGGSRIITSTLQTVLNVVEYQMDIAKAIQDPLRMHHQLIPNKIVVESTFPSNFQTMLEEKGHAVERIVVGFSGVSGIVKLDSGLIEASSDPRKSGMASAY